MSRSLLLPLAAGSAALLLSACQVGTKLVEQTGPRGTGMDQVVAKRDVVKSSAVPAPPYELTAAMRQGERASAAYQNVKVLGDISTDEFNYTMAAITTWVAPAEQGCNYCHNPENMASDEKYTKIVARRMLQMTRTINANWQPHVASGPEKAGVTCWTCHRGNAVPVNVWSHAAADPMTIKGNKHGQNTPLRSVAFASLPNDPFTTYLEGANNIRVAANSPYPSPDHVVAIGQAEKTYGLMMHTSQALGVNCTFCHNTHSFRSWADARPQRVTAWYGYRMVRHVNDDYIKSLVGVWPANRLGPGGDPYKVNCATCHQGVNKPMGGYPMLKDYPALAGPATASAPSAPTPPAAAQLTSTQAPPDPTMAPVDASGAPTAAPAETPTR